VLGAGGKLVGFSAPGGVGLKRRLLDLEGAVLPRAEKSSLTALTRRRSSGVRGT
jgi:hypothetical protein